MQNLLLICPIVHGVGESSIRTTELTLGHTLHLIGRLDGKMYPSGLLLFSWFGLLSIVTTSLLLLMMGS